VSVSVVIPTWNRAATLGRAIVSVACQNPLEVVVIDDASTDDTPGIVEQLRGVYPCIRYVRHQEKSADWQEAAADVYPTLLGSHVICMGADDSLTDGVVDSVNRHPDAAVIFHDYWCSDTNAVIRGSVFMGFEQVTPMTPDEARHRLLTYPYASETGIGSGIRRDCLQWLVSQKFWRMGPWSDAIGYAVVAALWGCVFVPGAGAIFAIDDAGYGARGREGAEALSYHQACREFLAGVNLPAALKVAILHKRGIHAHAA